MGRPGAFAAVLGTVLLANASETTLGTIRSIAGGPVVASLAIEVFPQGSRKDRHWAGIALVRGLLLALALGDVGDVGDLGGK
ncbi:MAG: hypothetical protein WBA68_00515 [Alteraurantiacibacter sp.]